jgi:cbb3-type cytochrome oxidase subunit 3
MSFFLFQIIVDVILWALVGVFIGTIVYLLGKKSGEKEGFDYTARMKQDYLFVEE